MFVINSSLGGTDCSGCQIFKKGKMLFAKRVQQPEYVWMTQMRNVAAARAALRRIRYAIKTGKHYVDLTDLE